MSEKIDETLKKVANNTQTGKTTKLSLEIPKSDLPGDPNCDICAGVGYFHLDLPLGHPDFGQLQVCPCRQGDLTRQAHQRLFAMSNLDELQHLNFENFKSRGRTGSGPIEAQSLEAAYESSQQFARTLDGWLVLQGSFGCGKTHLAAAIANMVVDLGIPTLFITVPDLLDFLRFSYDDPESTFEQRFEEIRNVPLLIMDDFGTQNATNWAQEKLFQIMNFRYINKLPMIITTNLMMAEIEPRILSRLSDTEFVRTLRILATDYRRPGHDSPGPLANLHKFTFDTFEMRKSENISPADTQSLEKALAKTLDFAEYPDGWLVITGPYGSGKTHLAAAIANYQAEKGYHIPMFEVVPDLMDHLRATFGPRSTVSLDRRFDEVRKAPLLILDDLGTQNMTSWAREKLYQLFNYRYYAEMPTVITTPELKGEMDPRLLSRMQDTRLCTICAITAPSYRGTKRARKKRRRRS
ncbi:MAG: ATP-binding protein [Chloroflexi bacterium]|nr:ATP-binding protein [Chloroflexota bacterium]